VTCPYRDDQYACDAILQELEIKNVIQNWFNLNSFCNFKFWFY
jgi:hypothetical protein